MSIRWRLGKASGLRENRSLQCKDTGDERRAMLASKYDSTPAAPFLSQVTSQMVREELQRLMLVVCQDRQARKRAPGRLSFRSRGPQYHCVGSCSHSPVCRAAAARLALFAIRDAVLERCPSPSLLDICPEINWANPLLGRMGWRVCILGG